MGEGSTGTSGTSGTRQVSIRPFEQWKPAGLAFSAKLSANRNFDSWILLYGAEHVETVLGTERWDALMEASSKPSSSKSHESLIGEVDVRCDLTSVTESARCMYPLTLFHGVAPDDQPLITTSIFLEWQEIRWLDEPEDTHIA